MNVSIKHETLQRVRFKFQRSLKLEEFDLLRSTFSLYFPDLCLYPSSLRSGCVICCIDESHTSSKLLLDFFNDFFAGCSPHGPACPPSRFESFRLQTTQAGIKASLFLAVLGWILPVLPGTPFFLMAWWLGWRPSTDSSEEVQN